MILNTLEDLINETKVFLDTYRTSEYRASLYYFVPAIYRGTNLPIVSAGVIEEVALQYIDARIPTFLPLVLYRIVLLSL